MPVVIGLEFSDTFDLTAVGTLALAIVTAAFVIAAFLQRKDTQRAADAAQRAALTSEKAVELQQQTAAEQSRLLSYPALGIEFFRTDDAAYLRLRNPSQLPAFDLDVMAVAVYNEEHDPPYAHFVSRYVRPNASQTADLHPDGEGTYGVYDHLVYDDIPPQRAVRARLGFPYPPAAIVAVVQFRDVIGRNYTRALWALPASDPGPSRYMTTSVAPIVAALVDTPRVDYLAARVPDLGAGAYVEADVPEPIRREFVDNLRHSFSSGYLDQPQLDVEERGTWEDV